MSIHKLNAWAIVLIGWIAFGVQAQDAACKDGVHKKIVGNVVLPYQCVFQQSLRISEGNTTLDCNGSKFIGNGIKKIGLLIDSRGEALSNVTIKNCIFEGFESSGIRVSWEEVDAQKGDNKKMIYQRTPNRIHIENVEVSNNGGVGIYIDDYVTEAVIKNSKVTGSGGAGIYLEHSSKNNKVIGNFISNNGFKKDKKTRREGVAIDSSAHNEVIGNIFLGNAAGGIFLYKNCGEHFRTGRQVIRWQHSNYNVIKQNKFVDEEVGVWLASRQNKRLKNWDCNDPKNANGNYDDFADKNIVEDNEFCRVKRPILDGGFNNHVEMPSVKCYLF